MEFHLESKLLDSAFLLGFVVLIFRLYKAIVLKPKRLRSILSKQGIRGPPPTFLIGNMREMKKAQSAAVANIKAPSVEPALVSHNYAPLIFPFIDQWRKQYGEVFMFSLGSLQILIVNQQEIVREITTCTSLDFGKPSYLRNGLHPLMGEGILTSNGTLWAHQRKILAPEFLMTKVKGAINLINECAITVLNSWNDRIDKESRVTEIKIDEYMRSFSADVISRTCFGSNYIKGKEIFSKLGALEENISKKIFSLGIPGMRYVPTNSNREAWALEKEVRKLILQVVKERQESVHEKDLLEMILEDAKNSDLSKEATDSFIVDNCKNIYLAGYDTTGVSATWCLMLLALNQEWQDRARAEVLEVCGGQIRDANMLRKMKQLTMVIHESLRLYPPLPVLSREALKDMKFGDIFVPKGVSIWTMVAVHHTDPNVWGNDAYQFNPDRYANGPTGACKFPHMYMPFGAGPRACLGQTLAMVELKIVLALILSNFSFTISPNYIHKPSFRLGLEPEHGVNLLVRRFMS